MATLKSLGLDGLYDLIKEKGRATPSVFARIAQEDTFDSINPRFCDMVCRAPFDKDPSCQRVDLSPADVVVLFSEKSRDSKFRTGAQDDGVLEGIIDHLLRTECPDLSYKVIYTLKCRPDPSVKKVTVTAAKPCSTYALNEVRKSNPKVIVATSTECLKALGFVKESVKKNLSEILYWNDIPVVVTLSPRVTTMIRQNASGAFWGDDFYELIRRDFAKVARIVAGEIPRQTAEEVIQRLLLNNRIHICRSLEDVRKVTDHICSLRREDIIAWDTETTGLDPWAPDAKFLCHQFGIKHADGHVWAAVIPLWHRENHYYDPDVTWMHVADALESPCTKVGHHGKFDLKYTRVTKGLHVVNYSFDTLYASHSLCSGLQGTYGLKKAVWDWIPESGLGGYEDLIWQEQEVTEDGDNSDD